MHFCHLDTQCNTSQGFASSIKAISISKTDKDATHLHKAIKRDNVALEHKTNIEQIAVFETSECVSFVVRGRLMAASVHK